MVNNQTMVVELCVKSKVVSSDFSMMKNIVAPPSPTLPIKLICCFEPGFSNSSFLLKSIAIGL